MLWRLFLCAAAMSGVSDELMFRWIKNAVDNGEGMLRSGWVGAEWCRDSLGCFVFVVSLQ